MGYVATRRLRFGDGWIEPGETVPEEEGRNYASLLALGHIIESKTAPKAARPAPEPSVPANDETPEVESAVDATDAAVVLAEAENIDLSTVEGSGKDGRIVEPDVQGAIAERDAG